GSITALQSITVSGRLRRAASPTTWDGAQGTGVTEGRSITALTSIAGRAARCPAVVTVSSIVLIPSVPGPTAPATGAGNRSVRPLRPRPASPPPQPRHLSRAPRVLLPAPRCRARPAPRRPAGVRPR